MFLREQEGEKGDFVTILKKFCKISVKNRHEQRFHGTMYLADEVF